MGDIQDRIWRAAVAVGLLCGAVFGAAAPTAAAPTTGCIDWASYATGSAPSGSGSLGVIDVAESQAAGSSVTLTEILGEDLDLRITWSNAHNGIVLDGGNTADFNDIDSYLAAAGGPASKTVFRYFPFDDQNGSVRFEFLEGGTNTLAPVQIDHLLSGGQRTFAGTTWGTSVFALTNAGAPVAAAFADNDLESVDNDGPASIAGLGSQPIIQLDAAQFGASSASAWVESLNAFATVGTPNTRDWTVLDWGSPSADTLVWNLFGNGAVGDPQPDPESADPTTPTFPHGGLSAYVSGLCITIPDDSVYDLALAKVESVAYDPVTQNASFEVTVQNQGNVGSGAFTVTDDLPAGTSFVSADNGGTSASGSVTWVEDGSTELAAGASRVFTLVLHVDDVSQSPFVNRAEISASSGLDCDSTPDTDLSSGDALVDITDPSVLASGTCEIGGADEDDHDVASFVVEPTTSTTPSTSTTPTTSGDADTPTTTAGDTDAGDASPPGTLPVTGSSMSLWLAMAGVTVAALGMIAVDSGAHLAWRQRLSASTQRRDQH